MGGDRRSYRIEDHADFLRGEIDSDPRVTIMQLREKLKDHCGMSFGYGTVWRFLARHKFTLKTTTAHAAEQDRDDVAAARDVWFERQHELDPAKLVFIDETSVSTNMARRFGWALQGERCRACVPHGHVWTPPSTQEKFRNGTARDRVRSCIRPSMRPISPRARMGFEDQVHITGARSKRYPCAWFS
jgi:hypothetical protein